MRWLWIGGWGLPSSHIEAVAQRYFPETEHHCLPPTRNWSDALPNPGYCLKHSSARSPSGCSLRTFRQQSAFTHIIGYSLGAFLLLSQIRHRALKETSVLLFAPFVDLKREAGVGGRIASTQLKVLRRRLPHQPLAVLSDFYTASGLGLPSPQKLPYPLEDLLWGIEVLLKETVTPSTFDPTLSFIGDCDPLLDASALRVAIPTLKVLSGADHRLESLVSCCQTEVRSQESA